MYLFVYLFTYLFIYLFTYFFFFIAATRGLFSDLPAESCKDIRDSGDSKGDGKYWIDPEKNGNPFEVYCDMTTDGGGIIEES